MTKQNNIEHPIDAVILWVDGNDENYKQRIIPYLKDTDSIKSVQFKSKYDQIDEIKFTIDSIIKFASYIRNIYIVTDNQTPSFLKNESSKNIYEKVSIIDHNIVFSGYEEYLPVFNCRPIETCIYRIPNLAEHFIYFNDDFSLINETKPSDFFKDGLPVLRGKWQKFDEDLPHKKFKKTRAGHKTAQQKAAQLLGVNSYYNFKHTPHPLRKSTFENYFEENKDVFIENIKHKFRHINQFTPQGLANHIEIKNKTCFYKDDLQLMYFRSYKKPLFWYKLKFNKNGKNKLFLGLQNLSLCPPKTLNYILKWLEKRIN